MLKVDHRAHIAQVVLYKEFFLVFVVDALHYRTPYRVADVRQAVVQVDEVGDVGPLFFREVTQFEVAGVFVQLVAARIVDVTEVCPVAVTDL